MSPVKRRRKGAQMTIEDVLSRGAASRATSSPAVSSPIPVSDSDSDDVRPAKRRHTIADSDDDSDDVPVKRRKTVTTVSDSDSDNDDVPIKRRHTITTVSDDDDDDDVPTRRRHTVIADSDNDSDSDNNNDNNNNPATPRTRLVRNASSPVSSAVKRFGRSARSARSEKQRHLELLRRRRMGHKVTESDIESELSDSAGRVALYDKDPDHVALSDFDDEEGEEKKEEDKKETTKKKEKKKAAEKESSDDSDPDDASDMADFIDDTLGVLGAPDGSDAEDEAAMLRREIPLQFTFQAHKPLKSHFRDAVEWLVHRRLQQQLQAVGGSTEGTFTQADNELYRVAWDRLDREVGGLAQSRFISSVWTAEFYSVLRARPYMDSFNIRPSGGGGRSGGFGAAARLLLPGAEENVCHACGRTNHPASFQVTFSGRPYTSTLDDVGGDGGGGGEDDDDDDNNNNNRDSNGNIIAPTSRRWLVGATCHSNAETAHTLLHWRRALKDWVDERMQADRLLDEIERKLAKSSKKKTESKKMAKKAKKVRAFGYTVTDTWEANGTINSLFREFKKMLEAAQAKSTQTSSRFGR